MSVSYTHLPWSHSNAYKKDLSELYYIASQNYGYLGNYKKEMCIRDRAKAEFADDYFEHEEEYEANIFAGMLLMPESSFRQMYRVFRAQSDNNEMDTLIRLMNYYQVPYMAALVRCYELGLTESGMLTQQLMELDKASIREKIENLWLDSSILDASNKDDYIAVERVVKRMGMEYRCV